MSLARAAQNPLAELSACFTARGLRGGAGLGLPGEDLTMVKLHPLADMVPGKLLLETYAKALVDANCAHGVVVSRRNLAALFDARGKYSTKRGSATNCFTNCAAFLRVRPRGPLADMALDPLDDTRVHPECYFGGEGFYDWAQKMCADGLDRDLGEGEESYSEVVAPVSYTHLTLPTILRV